MRLKLLILMILSTIISGCDRDENHLLSDQDVVLVEVDGKPLTKAMLEYLMTVRGVSEDDIDGMRALFDELIRLQAVANAAAREGISTRPEVRAERMLKDIELQYMRYLEQFQNDHPVTDQEVQTTYRDQLRRAGDTRWRLETIEFSDQAAALETIRSLRAGDIDFKRALQMASDQDRVARRTDWIDGSQLPPSFKPALDATAVGEIVEQTMPFETRWLVVRLVEREAMQAPPLDEVREGIRRALVREKSQAMIDLLFEQAEITPMLPLEASEATAGTD